jgi:hypothetical protein
MLSSGETDDRITAMVSSLKVGAHGEIGVGTHYVKERNPNSCLFLLSYESVVYVMYGRKVIFLGRKDKLLYRTRVTGGELCSSGGSATHQSAEGRVGEESCLGPYMSCWGPTET